MSSRENKIFDETGCLSEEALLRYAHERMDIHLKKQVEIHINECDFCRDALEGISLTKNKESARAAISGLNEKISSYGKEEPTGGKVILMNYWRYAAAVALFFVLGGGVLYIAFNPPFSKNTASDKMDEEKVLAENKNPVQEKLMDSATTFTEEEKPEDDNNQMKYDLEKAEIREVPEEDKQSLIIQDMTQSRAADEDNAGKDIIMEEKEVSAKGAASETMPVQADYFASGINKEPAPETDSEIVVAESKSKNKSQHDKKSEGKGAKSNKSNEETLAGAYSPAMISEAQQKSEEESKAKANADRKAREESARISEEKRLKEEAEAKSKAETEVLKVAEDRAEVEQARREVENEVQNEPDVFMLVEEMPQYPGGDEAMRKYIKDNIRYPQSARELSISGTVYVSYVVNETGMITKVKVSRGVNKEIDAEALRVVSSLKNYIPGKQAGKAVPVMITVPVRFTLE